MNDATAPALAKAAPDINDEQDWFDFVNAGTRDESPASQPAWLELAPKEKADLLMQVREHIATGRAALKPHEDLERAIFVAIQADMIARNASVVAHPELEITLKTETPKLVLGPELLAGLKALVDAGDVEKTDADKAAWTYTPPPEIKTHLTHIKSLQKKYGKTVDPLLAKTIRDLPVTHKLTIAYKKTEMIDVTPGAEATDHAN